MITSPGAFAFIRPTLDWQTMDLGSMDPKQFRYADEWFYIDTQIRSVYRSAE